MAHFESQTETCSMGKRVTTRFKSEPPRHFIKQWRKHRGLTQDQLAERIGVTFGLISQLETGRTGYSQPTLEALAEALGTTPASLLMRDPDQPDAAWSIADNLAKATPELRRQALAVVETLLKSGTDG